MRTLAMTAALAAALTGTGCIVSSTEPPVGDADVAWRFQNFDGQLAGDWTVANTGCGQAAISDVRLTVWDPAGRVVADDYFPCVDGTGYPRAYLSGLPAGRYTYAAEAWRVDAPVFYDEYFFDVFANEVTMEDATLPVLAVAPLTVYFTQRGVFTCAGTPSVRFDLYDPGAAFIESTVVPCTTSYGFTATADQATGYSYGLDVFALNAGGASVNERCLQSVRHTGFPATIDLLAAPQGACTP